MPSKKAVFDKTKDLNHNKNSDKFWKEFKKKHPKYKDIPERYLKDTLDDFFNFCGETLVTNKHGIVLNGIGYFANTVFDNKKIRRLEGFDMTLYNFKTNGDIYIVYVFPKLFPHNPLNGYSFKIVRKWARRMTKEINNGMRYLNHFSLLKYKHKKNKYFLNDK